MHCMNFLSLFVFSCIPDSTEMFTVGHVESSALTIHNESNACKSKPDDTVSTSERNFRCLPVWLAMKWYSCSQKSAIFVTALYLLLFGPSIMVQVWVNEPCDRRISGPRLDTPSCQTIHSTCWMPSSWPYSMALVERLWSNTPQSIYWWHTWWSQLAGY